MKGETRDRLDKKILSTNVLTLNSLPLVRNAAAAAEPRPENDILCQSPARPLTTSPQEAHNTANCRRNGNDNSQIQKTEIPFSNSNFTLLPVLLIYYCKCQMIKYDQIVNHCYFGSITVNSCVVGSDTFVSQNFKWVVKFPFIRR